MKINRFCLIILICITCIFTGCKGKNKNKEEHIHNYINGECSCGDKLDQINGVTHIHTYQRGICDCGNRVKETENLDYKLSDDKTYYIVTGMGSNRGKLTHLVVPSFYNDLPVQEIGEEALRDRVLSSVILQEGIRIIGERAFDDSGELREIHLPQTLEIISKYAFSECNIEKLVLPTNVVTISDYAFYGCKNLKSVHFSKSVQFIGENAFYGSTNLENITVDVNNQNYVAIDNVLYTKDLKTLVKYPPLKANKTFEILDSITKIEDYAFDRCNNLENVILSSNLTDISTYAFSLCNNLKYNELDNIKYLGSKDNLYDLAIGYIDSSITKCKINSNTKIIANFCFENYFKLEEITLSEGLISIGKSAFRICSSLKSLSIPSSVETIKGTIFYGCSSLTLLNVSEDNKFYKAIYSVLYSKDGKILYEYAYGLKNSNFEIPYGVEEISDFAFNYCSSLNQIVIPETVKRIGNAAFRGTSISNISLPKSVQHIGDNAFAFTNIKSIYITSNVITIGEYVFDNCYNIVIYCENTQKPDGWNYYWCYEPESNADGYYYPPKSYEVIWDYNAK